MAEDFDVFHVRQMKQQATADALAQARAERGQWASDDERAAVAHNIRWGSDGYPLRKLRKGWTLDHPAAKGTPMYRLKREAVAAWETLIATWIAVESLRRRTVQG